MRVAGRPLLYRSGNRLEATRTNTSNAAPLDFSVGAVDSARGVGLVNVLRKSITAGDRLTRGKFAERMKRGRCRPVTLCKPTNHERGTTQVSMIHGVNKNSKVVTSGLLSTLVML